jgi:hypothetical protein
LTDWLTSRRRPPGRQHPARRDDDPARHRSPPRFPLAGAQGRRLVARAALRFSPTTWAPLWCAPTISRTVIDVNRDPSGVSLYPGQATTGLCPDRHLRRRAAVSTRARTRTPPRSPSAARPSSIPTTPASRPNSTGWSRAMARWCCTTPTRSVRARLACSMASCRSSTSARTAARPAIRTLTRRVEAACDATGLLASHRRPLQGRLDHPPLRSARARRPRHADGAGLPRLHRRAGAAHA